MYSKLIHESINEYEHYQTYPKVKRPHLLQEEGEKDIAHLGRHPSHLL
jgi:hypothetical protein